MRGTDRQHEKAATEKGMCRVYDFDLGYNLFKWVLEGGIKLMVRSTG
jgi:hypothetical protein